MHRFHAIGTPDEVIATSTALATAFGADELMFIFKYGGLPLAEAERSVQLFADEVMPTLQALDTEPLQPLRWAFHGDHAELLTQLGIYHDDRSVAENRPERCAEGSRA